MYKQFTTSVIVFKDLQPETEVLLIHHKKFDRWMVPGGHIESLENPNEAAVREVLEESGVNIRLVSFLHTPLPAEDGECLLAPEYLYQQLIPASKKEGAHYHLDLTYIAEAVTTDLVVNLEETNGVKWVPVSELPYINLFHGTRITIMDAHSKLSIK